MAGRQPISTGGRATGVALTAAVFVVGCGGAEGTGPSVGRVEITPDNTLLVGIGDTVTLEARVYGTGGSTLSGAAVVWRALDPEVVDVDGAGLVTAAGPGVGRLTASSKGVDATARVEVWIPDEPADYVPGASYFGRQGYVEYVPGRLPVVLSAPHGGHLEPTEIPDRTYGTLVTDSNTRQTLLAVRDAFLERAGSAPHVVISHLRRTKLDPNREIVEAAQGNAFAENAWAEFQGFVERATDRVEADFGAGLYFDLHGHGHDVPRVEIGLLLDGGDLEQPDAALEALAVLSSLSALASRVEIGFGPLIRGPGSLGAMLADRGVPSVPSPADPDPGDAPYFSGGYNTARHGSREGGTVDGMQLELHFPGVRDDVENRRAFGAALAASVELYMLRHYGFFTPSSPLGPPRAATRAMASPGAAPLH